AEVLTQPFLSGGALPVLDAHLEVLPEMADVSLLEQLFQEGLRRYPDDDDLSHNQLDAWLAPRVHYALRISRRTASQAGLWGWLAMTSGRNYVHHRWFDKDERLVRKWRYYHEDVLRNAISRLWWGAELSRDGSSYTMVPVVFEQVRRAQFALELRYSWYR